MNTKISAILAASVSSAALAQSASVAITAPATAAPGDTVMVSVSSTFDVATGTDGIFGKGLYGFGGSVVATGAAAAGSANAIDDAFPSLRAFGSNTGASANLVGAGRGTMAPVTASPANLFTYSIDIPTDAMGQIDLAYEGAVVLDVNGTLETYSTSPGTGQNPLTVTGATIMIQAGPMGCNAADLAAPFGILNSSDVNAFVAAFLGNTPEADLAAPTGIYNSSDINAFVAAFLASCP